MAENQSAASEDSGHQQQQQQQQQQQHHQQQQQQPPLASTSSLVNAVSPAASSLVNQSPTNSQASSPENSQEALPLVRRQQSAAATVAVAATSSNTPQQQQQQQRSSLSNMFDRTVNAKFKTSAANAGTGQNPGRRNSMLTPAKGASVGGTGGNIRKLTKVNSLTRDYAMCYGPNIYQNSNNAGSNAAATLQRTTSESLRLNSLNRVSRASSNTSLPTATVTTTSTSTSLLPKSSSSSGSDSNATPQQQQSQASGNSRSRGSSGGKASSPNNNGARAVGGAAAATAAGPAGAIGTASHHHQPHHHHHHHHHHQYHHHQQQHPHQTSLSQGHASLTVSSGASGSGSTGGSGAGSTTRKPKTTSSFEITSVTVGNPKLNAAGDTGDESADDLDESHTDDNSRITDLENETPSMSEDTFSKEEVYYANNALSTNAPVIPTSSQYGLVVVDPIGPSLGQTIQNVQVNVSDNIINVVSAAVTPGGTKKKDDIKETQHRSERFKVVKIESTEPFKRGRWMCMDYLDHSSVGSGGNNNEKTGSSSEATTDGVGGSDGPPQKTTQSMILPPTQKLNENHLEANSTDANWNYAEQQSQQQQSAQQQQHQQHSQQQQQQSSHQQQQPQMSATPSGVMTAPATVVHGMHQLHMEAQQQQQQQLFDSVNANASSPNPQSVDTGNMGYALTAAMQLQQTLQQLKQREEAMESGYQNGGDVPSVAPNNNNSGGGGGAGGAPAAATTESQLSTSYVEQQQPLSPAPQTPQITPTFAAVAAGQAAPNFQLEPQPQATSQIDGILPQTQFPQQQQQQQTPQQSTPQQQAPPLAAAATSVGGTAAAAATAIQQQTSNTSNAAVTTGQGQTLPLLSHMTSYEQQPPAAGAGGATTAGAGTGAAATSVAVAPSVIPTLHLQSAPATIADPQQLMVPQQQQDEHQQQQQQQQIPPTNIASASANNSNLNLTNPNVVANAELTKNALTLTDEQLTAATTATGAAATSAPAATSTSAAMQLQQLQQQPNAESETESFITSAIPGGNRKRAFSNPHIGIIGGVGGGLGAGGLSVDPGAFMHRLNPQLYYYNKSQSGRSSFCVDESLWPTNPNHNARASDTNLYMGSSTDEDYEEAIDQFSPTLYTRTGASRAIPIPTSAGNSPQHQLHPHLNPHPGRIATGINSAAAAAAFSASPSIYAYPHSPFYASSPETSSLSSSAQMSGMPAGHPGPSSRISFSYDPAFQRLQVPKTRSPLECASVLAAVAAAATCGDAQQMGLATPCNRSVPPSFSWLRPALNSP
ncbi:protein bunched, class 2/F/G isoform-like [Drosophila serrata]|uniref:protein bunched, class 2/F/G isoform-like n=1 Tax=Drosophila serrata TaxID=7274 RepID=UPI000A1D10F3|nr:protein bunched, class 2/F/G isoform-like [Drosophila serrata]